jgi:hypothetical protein
MIYKNQIVAVSIVTLLVFGGWWLFSVLFGQSTPVEETFTDLTLPPLPPQSVIDAMRREAVVQYDSFVTQHAGVAAWEPFVVDGRQIVAPAGIAGLGAKMPPEIEAALNVNDWGIYSCPGEISAPSFVLRLAFALQGGNEVLPYDQKMVALRAWEPAMLDDVRTILYPHHVYNYEQYVTQPFKDSMVTTVSGIREAVVSDGVVPVGMLSYVVLGDMLLLGTDTTCMTNLAVSILGLVP